MARLMFAVFAQRVVVDKFTNNMDINAVIEELRIPRPSQDLVNKARAAKKHLAAQGVLVLVMQWRRTNPKKPEKLFRSRIEFRGPRGRVLATAEQDINILETLYMRGLVGYPSIPIAEEGTYIATIARKSGARWIRAGEASFQIAYQDVPPPESKRRIH
jgi:hypothetical protein